MIIVTGGAGFIGANFVLDWLAQSDEPIATVDKLAYAGNRDNLATLTNDPRHSLHVLDIANTPEVESLVQSTRPRAIIHFAAESHVDRSIHGPADFIQTNVVGTFSLLEVARRYFDGLDDVARQAFRFVHVSTDEVYGSLQPDEPAFTEQRRFEPNSPYSASKAASDHLVRAWCHTYGLPVLTSNCSNNYGPFQFPEKLIPLMIANALAGKPLPVYGDGNNVRDWLYVGDHCAAIRAMLQHGRIGETYNIGGCNEQRNMEIVHALCDLLDELKPLDAGKSYRAQIQFVTDRPGHDRRYAVNADKAIAELNWSPAENLVSGLRKTVIWYLEHQDWVARVSSGAYRSWIETQYAQRGAA